MGKFNYTYELKMSVWEANMEERYETITHSGQKRTKKRLCDCENPLGVQFCVEEP